MTTTETPRMDAGLRRLIASAPFTSRFRAAFDNMSVADQQLLEDFDTGRLHKRRKEIVGDRLPSFRSQVPSASAAAEHANYQ